MFGGLLIANNIKSYTVVIENSLINSNYAVFLSGDVYTASTCYKINEITFNSSTWNSNDVLTSYGLLTDGISIWAKPHYLNGHNTLRKFTTTGTQLLSLGLYDNNIICMDSSLGFAAYSSADISSFNLTTGSIINTAGWWTDDNGYPIRPHTIGTYNASDYLWGIGFSMDEFGAYGQDRLVKVNKNTMTKVAKYNMPSLNQNSPRNDKLLVTESYCWSVYPDYTKLIRFNKTSEVFSDVVVSGLNNQSMVIRVSDNVIAFTDVTNKKVVFINEMNMVVVDSVDIPYTPTQICADSQGNVYIPANEGLTILVA